MSNFAVGGTRKAGSARSSMTLVLAATIAALLFGVIMSSLASSGRSHSGGLSLQSMDMTSSSSVSIEIKGYAFNPADVTISTGTTVTWTNEDTAPHTVTVSDGPVKFDSGTLQKGQSYSYTFTTAGTYKYYCAVHPDMTASITVVDSSASAPPATTPAPATSSPAPMTMPAPATSPAPAASPPMTMTPSSGCSGANAAADTFLKHVYAGHLGESAGQQVADASNVNQYALTHTVLVGNMLAPLVSGTDSSLGAFLTHFYAGHLGESPGQQVGDALNVDQYAKTHTVLVGNMAAPLVGTPGC